MVILFREELYVDVPLKRGRGGWASEHWQACEIPKWTAEDVRDCIDLLESGSSAFEVMIYRRDNKALYDPEAVGLRWGHGVDDLMEIFDIRRPL